MSTINTLKNLQVKEKQPTSFHIYTFRSAAKIPEQSQHECMPAIRSTCIMLLAHKFIAWWYPPYLPFPHTA